MPISFMFFVALQTEATRPRPSDVIQALLLGILIVFVFSTVAAGLTAKRLNGIRDATYFKAFGATLLKNMFGWTAVAIFGLYLQAPLLVTAIIAAAIIPIIVYRLVFSCMWPEATMVWLVAFVVEAAVTAGLVLAGLVKLGQLSVGGA